MLSFRIIAISFSLVMIYVVRIQYVRKHIPLLESLFWTLVWLGLIGVVLKPQILQSLAASLAIYRVFDLLTVVAFMLLFSFVILDRIKIYNMEKKLHDLVRSNAIVVATEKLKKKK